MEWINMVYPPKVQSWLMYPKAWTGSNRQIHGTNSMHSSIIKSASDIAIAGRPGNGQESFQQSGRSIFLSGEN
jgi:hypothetical protein